MKTVAFYTLGCKVNQYETQGLAELFSQRGYQEVPFNAKADLYIINTCTVTHVGDRKSRQVIRRAVRRNPQAVVLVTGCYAQVAAQEVAAIPGVNLVVGTKCRESLVELAEESQPNGPAEVLVPDIETAERFEELPGVAAYPGGVRALLKIQEGCREFCTYCIVPYARGPLRSRLPANVIQLAEAAVDKGYREIVLTGTNLGAYGRDLGNYNLADIINSLAKISGLRRLRLSSIEPGEITPQLMAALQDNEICCPHLHLPLQSGSTTVLKRMGRKYSQEDLASLLKLLINEIPGLAITADIITGFPGESPQEHKDSLWFLENIGVAGLHVFVYSPRQGTPAYSLPEQISPPVKEERRRDWQELDRKMRTHFNTKYLKKKVQVLIESTAGTQATGYTSNYIKTTFPGGSHLLGQLADIWVTHNDEGILGGILADKAGFSATGVK